MQRDPKTYLATCDKVPLCHVMQNRSVSKPNDLQAEDHLRFLTCTWTWPPRPDLLRDLLNPQTVSSGVAGVNQREN